MPDPRVALDPALAHHLRLDAWDALDDGGRLALGDHLAERLQAHGWGVAGPLMLGTFGPPDSPRSALRWREPTSGMTFSLVPGGTFRPGFDDAQLARFEALYRRHEGEHEPPYGLDAEDEPLPRGRLRAFASLAPCDVRLKAPVEVPPLLMAAELVRPSLPGIRSVVRLPDHYFEPRGAHDHAFMGDAILFEFEQVGPVLEHYGWSTPTSAEFEWALRGGGGDSLFPWGDDLPAFARSWREPPGPEGDEWRRSFEDVMSATFDVDRPRTWPWCNRFGLAAMLPIPTICARSEEPGDPAPQVIRGGAAYCYPWQGCGEWQLLLNAVECRYSDESAGGESVAIRPVIRLGAGPGQSPKA